MTNEDFINFVSNDFLPATKRLGSLIGLRRNKEGEVYVTPLYVISANTMSRHPVSGFLLLVSTYTYMFLDTNDNKLKNSNKTPTKNPSKNPSEDVIEKINNTNEDKFTIISSILSWFN